jgi:tungstate transport system ATP-binding protein
MSTPPLYRLEQVARDHGGRPALRLERLDIPAGDVLVLVGPVGAGKSTLLRLLAGLDAPMAGAVWFAGHRLGGRDVPLAVRRRVTLVFQRPVLLTGTVRANVEYGLRLRGLGRGRAEVQEVLDRLGLGVLAARPARALSGGETQLVALARALVLRPEVLLLDEPTNNLDPARVARVEAAVAALHRARGTTLVWATHNLFQARRVARRVAFLLDGELVELAATETFFNAPQDPRTAAFVRGEMVY